jgi:hypothetical protein
LVLHRDGGEGDLTATVLLEGSATFGSDYSLGGADTLSDTQFSVVIPDGEAFAEILLEALDDIAAEADETVVVRLEPGAAYRVARGSASATVTIPKNDFVVTTAEDDGEGSLRQAILNANAMEGPASITFDTEEGPFGPPQTITLDRKLPELAGELTIDGNFEGFLWQAKGVIVSGDGRLPVFRVGAGATVNLRHLTIADGRGREGGGIRNLGKLVIRGATFLDNEARRDGGAIANSGGSVTVINSTFAGNRAESSGGGLANLSGQATVTNCTFSENSADQGGAVYNDGRLLLRNTILANSPNGGDCVSEQDLDTASTRNLIEENRGCGTPISSADPRLQALNYYNGPAKTFPVSGGSPAVNLGDNAAAVDEHGEPLVWDQRSNGDPRFVAGFTDLGAFEHQRHPVFSVDTLEDTVLRACTQAGAADCPLRGAIEIANTTPEADVIGFDPKLFGEHQQLELARPLPEITSDLVLDAGATNGVTIRAAGRFHPLEAAAGVKLELIRVAVENGPGGAGGKSGYSSGDPGRKWRRHHAGCRWR